jgi:hypothetical protein
VEKNHDNVDYSYLTDMIEYNIFELQVNADGSVENPVNPYEIIAIRTTWDILN